MKAFLTMAGSVFLGAAMGVLQADPTVLFSVQGLRPALAGAVMAGLIAVVHLYQPSPPVAPVSAPLPPAVAAVSKLVTIHTEAKSE